MNDERFEVSLNTAVIGSLSGDHVKIEVLGRMYLGATDFSDGNWLMSPVEVVAGGFTGRVPANLRAEELCTFRDQLASAYEKFGGVARLESMEEWLVLVVTVEASGRMRVDGSTVDQVGSKNKLTFHIGDMDQTQLPTLVDSLTTIEERFPVLGRP